MAQRQACQADVRRPAVTCQRDGKVYDGGSCVGSQPGDDRTVGRIDPRDDLTAQGHAAGAAAAATTCAAENRVVRESAHVAEPRVPCCPPCTTPTQVTVANRRPLGAFRTADAGQAVAAVAAHATGQS